MNDKWEDKGVVPNFEHDIPNALTFNIRPTHSHKVENTETGEERQVRVDPGQTVGEAIANGQWED